MKIKLSPFGSQDIVPKRATDGSAGYDLRSAFPGPVTLQPGETFQFPCGFHMEIPEGIVGLAFPRSGWAIKHGITLKNVVGVIDSDYRGEMCIFLTNHSNEPVTIQPKDRIAQIVFAPFISPEIEVVKELSDTKRGTGGWGSTGTK
jgi:dUTP pyrophosphatase